MTWTKEKIIDIKNLWRKKVIMESRTLFWNFMSLRMIMPQKKRAWKDMEYIRWWLRLAGAMQSMKITISQWSTRMDFREGRIVRIHSLVEAVAITQNEQVSKMHPCSITIFQLADHRLKALILACNQWSNSRIKVGTKWKPWPGLF